MTESPTSRADRVETLMTQAAARIKTGRYDEAEALLRDALVLGRGTGTAAECRACGNLGTVFALQERRFEAILLFRRGLAVARALGHARFQALHLSNLATAFVGLDLSSHVQDTLDDLDRLAAGEAPEARASLLDLALWPRAWRAIGDGDLVEARSLAAAYRAFLADREDPLARVTVLALEVTLLRKEGRAGEALALVDGWVGDAPTLKRTYVRILRLGCLQALERHEAARAEAPRLLAGFESGGARPGFGELDIEMATDVAQCLARDPASAGLARRAYDVAAAVTLCRIAELDALTRNVPELASLDDDDRAWIRDLEAHYRQEQGTLLEHVAALLRSGREDDAAFLYTGGHDRSLVRLCAWCKRVSTRKGHWLPLAHYIPVDPEVLVTHGICAECRETTEPHA